MKKLAIAAAVVLAAINLNLYSDFVLPANSAGDRDSWRHFMDEGSKHEVFGDFAGAERDYLKSLNMANPPAASAAERAEVMARLANSMIWQQKFDRAEPYFNELLKIIPSLKGAGKHNEDFFSCVEALSNAYYDRVRGNKRVSGIQHSIRLIDTAFGDDHPELLKELYMLAQIYSALGRNPEALSFANRALLLAKKDKSDKGQIQYAKTLALVGTCRKLVGDWAGAEKALENAVFLMNSGKKKFSLSAASANAELAIVNYHVGKKEESKHYFRESESLFNGKMKALEGKEARQVGSSGPEFLALAEMYIAFGQYAKAEAICRKAIFWTQMSYGPKDPNLTKEFQVHGYVLSRLGRLKDSQQQEAAAQAVAAEYNGLK